MARTGTDRISARSSIRLLSVPEPTGLDHASGNGAHVRPKSSMPPTVNPSALLGRDEAEVSVGARACAQGERLGSRPEVQCFESSPASAVRRRLARRTGGFLDQLPVGRRLVELTT
jgi:hypothetical protein